MDLNDFFKSLPNFVKLWQHFSSSSTLSACSKVVVNFI